MAYSVTSVCLIDALRLREVGDVAGRIMSERLIVPPLPSSAVSKEPGGRYVMPRALCSPVRSCFIPTLQIVISPAELLEVYAGREIRITVSGFEEL